jgi:hypothetical protein
VNMASLWPFDAKSRGEAGMMSGTLDDAILLVVEPVRQLGQGTGSVRRTHNVQ